MDEEEDYSKTKGVNKELYTDQLSKAPSPWAPDVDAKIPFTSTGRIILPGETYFGGSGEVWSFAEDTSQEGKWIGRELINPLPYPSDHW